MCLQHNAAGNSAKHQVCSQGLYSPTPGDGKNRHWKPGSVLIHFLSPYILSLAFLSFFFSSFPPLFLPSFLPSFLFSFVLQCLVSQVVSYVLCLPHFHHRLTTSLTQFCRKLSRCRVRCVTVMSRYCLSKDREPCKCG